MRDSVWVKSSTCSSRTSLMATIRSPARMPSLRAAPVAWRTSKPASICNAPGAAYWCRPRHSGLRPRRRNRPGALAPRRAGCPRAAPGCTGLPPHAPSRHATPMAQRSLIARCRPGNLDMSVDGVSSWAGSSTRSPPATPTSEVIVGPAAGKTLRQVKVARGLAAASHAEPGAYTAQPLLRLVGDGLHFRRVSTNRLAPATHAAGIDARQAPARLGAHTG